MNKRYIPLAVAALILAPGAVFTTMAAHEITVGTDLPCWQHTVRRCVTIEIGGRSGTGLVVTTSELFTTRSGHHVVHVRVHECGFVSGGLGCRTESDARVSW